MRSLLSALAVFSAVCFAEQTSNCSHAYLDWSYDSRDGYMSNMGMKKRMKSRAAPVSASFASASFAAPMSSFSSAPAAAMGGSAKMVGGGAGGIGFAVGGAKDVNSFRENIKAGKLPIPSDVTYEGLFYKYFFNTMPTIADGAARPCQKLFCPSYSMAFSYDPIAEASDEAFLPDVYMAVGLDSGLTDFSRPELNLVVVLDISGSMGSGFDQYYYDNFNVRHTLPEEERSSKSKMTLAAESVAALVDQLKDADRLGIVLFDSSEYVALDITKVCGLDVEGLKQKVLTVGPRGGTNMQIGYKAGTRMIKSVLDRNRQNRIIFLTDAQPNAGDQKQLLTDIQSNAEEGIYTTVLGIGLDLNTQLVEKLTKVRGANHYSTFSAKQLRQRLAEEFDYMVTPLVFDLRLQVSSDSYRIARVYGSPESDEATGEIMHVRSLFPSAKTEEGVRGGVVLLQLSALSQADPNTVHLIKLSVTYEDGLGVPGTDERLASIPALVSLREQASSYASSGVRKAIMLSRYANSLKNWLADQPSKKDKPQIVSRQSFHMCPCCPIPLPPLLGEWERTSNSLVVAPEYKTVFAKLLAYMNEEFLALGDQDLQDELDVLALLLDAPEGDRVEPIEIDLPEETPISIEVGKPGISVAVQSRCLRRGWTDEVHVDRISMLRYAPDAPLVPVAATVQGGQIAVIKEKTGKRSSMKGCKAKKTEFQSGRCVPERKLLLGWMLNAENLCVRVKGCPRDQIRFRKHHFRTRRQCRQHRVRCAVSP